MMNVDKKIEHAWKLFLNNQEMIRFSDSKLRFLAVISGVLTSFVLVNLTSLAGDFWYGIFSVIIFCLSFLLFVIFALLSSFPRFASKTGNKIPKLIYYKHISDRIEPNEYITDFLNTSDEDHLKDILYQVYEVSGIASKKFKHYHNAWYALGIQIITFSSLLMIQALS